MSLFASLLLSFMTLASQPETDQFPSGLISLSQDPALSTTAIVVDKATRTLKVYEVNGSQPKKVVEHPTDIGKKSGDKQRENDHRTPVGIYFLLERKTQPEIPFDLYGNLAFTTDYPNIFDRRLDKTGSGIWLHAVPDSVPLTRGPPQDMVCLLYT
ncbi:hypothetical protein EBR03_09440, partial [bacterium]|nr:hypothetical protein [bacterium]